MTIVAKYESRKADKILKQIEESSVFGRKRGVKPKRKIETQFNVRETEAVPSHGARVHSTAKVEPPKYTGELELNVGVGYNKGGLQTLLKSELRDAGKKTNQLQ